MNTKFRKEANMTLRKIFFKLTNTAVFGKAMENVRKHRYINPVTTNKKKSLLVSEPNYNAIKWFSED